MRKWAFLTAATAAVVIGCGGNGGAGGGGGGGIGGGTGVSRARVNDSEMNKPGLITTTYISGQGRGSGPTISAVFRFLSYTPDPNTPAGQRVESTLNPELLVGLDGYTHNSASLNSATISGSSRTFDIFTLNVQKIRQATGDPFNPFIEFTNPQNPNAPLLSEEFDLLLRTMSGRHVSVPIFLDDAMLNHDGVNVQFDRGLFELANYDLAENKILGLFSDYVSFDLTSMAAGSRPNLISPEGAGATADAVHFSGDSIALSAEVGGERVFEVLTPLGHIAGKWNPPVNSGPVQTPFGTYTLLEVDPRVLPVPNAARLVALQGMWRPYDLMLLDLGAFEMFTIPSSEDRDDQDMVMVLRNGNGRIVNMYFGFVDFASGQFSAFPIDQVDDGAVGNEIVGTVGGLVDANGSSTGDATAVRSGNFTFATSSLPGGFLASGRFVVMRR